MDDKTCKENIRLAEEKIEAGTIPDIYFWRGYFVGMKSHYYDDPEEHSTWLAYFDRRDIEYHSMGIGYRTGYSGANFSMAEHISKDMEESFEAFIKVEEEWENKPRNNTSGCLVLLTALGVGTVSLVYFL